MSTTTTPPPARFDAAAIADFLIAVHHHPGDLALMALRPRGTKGAPLHARFTDPDAATKWAAARDREGSAGVYLRATNLAPGVEIDGRGSEADSAALGYLWADLDYGTEGHKAGTPTAKRQSLPLPPDAETVLQLIDGLPEPTAITHSGGGLYPYWVLSEPLDLTTETGRALAAKLSTGWQAMIKHRATQLGYEYGAGVGDLARVLRLPGTVNRKTDNPRPCYLVHADGPTYDGDALQVILSTWQAEQAAAAAATEAAEETARRVERHYPDKAMSTERRDSVLDVLASSCTWPELMAAAGWTDAGYVDSQTLHAFIRPGGSGSVSVKVLHDYPLALKVWSENAGIPTDTAHSMGSAFAWLHYGGDLAAAARALEAGTGPGVEDLPGHVLEALAEHAKTKRATPRGDDDEDDDGTQAGRWTENALSERAAVEALSDFRWTAAAGWLRWDGTKWNDECTDAEAQGAVRQWARQVMRDVLTDPRTPKETKKAARIALGSGKGINAITSLSRSQVLADFAQFDTDPDILVCPNGVLDLRTGELMPHSRDRLVTKCAGVDYVPGARSDDWEKALSSLRPDAREWMQAKWGQAVTGHPADDDVMPVLQGGGSNGKSSVLGPINAAMGSYADTVSDSLLLAENSAHPTDFMDLKGLRLAYVEELPDRHMNTTRLKKLVGTEYLKARKMRADFVSFKVTHSFVCTSNFEPGIDDTDGGTWRRLALVVFPFRYLPTGEDLEGKNDRRGDRGLRERVKGTESLQACLAWLVEGARAWYAANRETPAPPQSVRDDTRAWRRKTDALMAYADDNLIADPGSVIPTRVLLDHFNGWLQETRRQHAWSDRTLSGRFGAHEWSARAGVSVERRRHPRESWSLPPKVSYTPAAAFPAWVGVRFRTAADEMRERAALAEAEAREPIPEPAPVAPKLAAVVTQQLPAAVGDDVAAATPARCSGGLSPYAEPVPEDDDF